jgi:hypothetical protein
MPAGENAPCRLNQQKFIYIAQINEKANFKNELQPLPAHSHLRSIDFRFPFSAAAPPCGCSSTGQP